MNRFALIPRHRRQRYSVHTFFASGFEITTELNWRCGIDPITGRNGLSLYDHWANGYRTFHGMMSHGFPNQFFTGCTEAGVSANTTAMFDQQGSHIAQIIGETLARGAATVEPSRQAQDEWVRIIRDASFTDRNSGGNARPAITTARAKKCSDHIWASPTAPASTLLSNCCKNGATRGIWRALSSGNNLQAAAGFLPGEAREFWESQVAQWPFIRICLPATISPGKSAVASD
jgi:hypothetical protein